MGFQSQGGHVGFRTQSSKGAFLNPGSGGVFMRTRSGALVGRRELLIPDPEIGGGRDLPDAYLGPVAFVGEYEFYARLEALATLLKGAFGSADTDVDTPEADAHTHTITPTDSELPWLSVEEQIADGYDAFRYTDVKVNSLHFEADANGYLMGTVGLIGLTQLAVPLGSVTASPEFDITPMIVGSNVTLSFDDVDLRAKSFSFDLNNNLEEDDFRLGSLFLGDAVEKRREFIFGATIRPEDHALLRQAVFGDPDATSAQGTVVKDNVTLRAETYEVIGATSTAYSLEIEVPVAVIAPFEVNPSGDDVIQHDLEIRALRPDPDEAIASIVVVNGADSVA